VCVRLAVRLCRLYISVRVHLHETAHRTAKYTALNPVTREHRCENTQRRNFLWHKNMTCIVPLGSAFGLMYSNSTPLTSLRRYIWQLVHIYIKGGKDAPCQYGCCVNTRRRARTVTRSKCDNLESYKLEIQYSVDSVALRAGCESACVY
jgi:hypothetical protein